MFDRHKFFIRYQMKFDKDFKKSMEGFSPEEQIHIIDGLISIVALYRKSPIDYDGIGKIFEELQKKYRKRFLNFYNTRLTEYFNEKSMKHLDLQTELKVEKSGYEEKFFTEEERQEFLKSTLKLFQLHKEMMYLYSEPEGEQKETFGETTAKKKNSRTRNDGATLLNEEQIALLIPILQRSRILLPDIKPSYIGDAMETLSGFGSDSLRQLLSPKVIKSLFTERNLKVLHDGLTRAITLIETQLRELKKNAKPS
jgi:hypothetical protein